MDKCIKTQTLTNSTITLTLAVEVLNGEFVKMSIQNIEGQFKINMGFYMNFNFIWKRHTITLQWWELPKTIPS